MVYHKDGSIYYLVGIQSELRQFLSAPNYFKPTRYTQADKKKTRYTQSNFEISK